jgi:hypothetical protein
MQQYIVHKRGYLNVHLVLLAGRIQAKATNKEKATSITAVRSFGSREKNNHRPESYTGTQRATERHVSDVEVKEQ